MSLSVDQMNEDRDDVEFEFLLKELLNDDESTSSSSNSQLPIPEDDFSNPFYLQPPEYYRKNNNKTRRKSTNPTFMPSLRIFRRDIRRKYGEMFVNVMNNHDSILLSKFFHEYCRPDCYFDTTTPSDEKSRKTLKNALQKNSNERYNLNEVIDGFKRNFDLMPDSTFRLNNTQVRIKQGEKGSVIIAKTRIIGTRLFEVGLIDESVVTPSSDSDEDMSSSDDASSVTTMASSDSSLQKSDSQSEEVEVRSSSCFSNDKEYWRRFRWTRLTTPMESLMELVFTMALDETNHILRFQFDCQAYSERPVPGVSA